MVLEISSNGKKKSHVIFQVIFWNQLLIKKILYVKMCMIKDSKSITLYTAQNETQTEVNGVIWKMCSNFENMH